MALQKACLKKYPWNEMSPNELCDMIQYMIDNSDESKKYKLRALLDFKANVGQWNTSSYRYEPITCSCGLLFCKVTYDPRVYQCKICRLNYYPLCNDLSRHAHDTYGMKGLKLCCDECIIKIHKRCNEYECTSCKSNEYRICSTCYDICCVKCNPLFWGSSCIRCFD